VVRGDAAEAEQRAGDGDLLAFGEGEDLGFGARVRDTVTGEDDGLLCGLDELDSLLDGEDSARKASGADDRARGGRFEVERCRGLFARPSLYPQVPDLDARLRDLERLADGGGDVFGAGDEVVVLVMGRVMPVMSILETRRSRGLCCRPVR